MTKTLVSKGWSAAAPMEDRARSPTTMTFIFRLYCEKLPPEGETFGSCGSRTSSRHVGLTSLSGTHCGSSRQKGELLPPSATIRSPLQLRSSFFPGGTENMPSDRALCLPPRTLSGHAPCRRTRPSANQSADRRSRDVLFFSSTSTPISSCGGVSAGQKAEN